LNTTTSLLICVMSLFFRNRSNTAERRKDAKEFRTHKSSAHRFPSPQSSVRQNLF